MTAELSDHRGELRESQYGFVCWVVCDCGWRTEGYPSSAEAWTAHAWHHAAVVDDD